MRPALRAYIAVIVVAAVVLGAWDLPHIGMWPHKWEYYQVALLLGLCIVAMNFTFLMHGGWYTAAGTVPQIAASFLLPPGLAELITVIGALSRVKRARMPWPRAAFNTAKAALAVGVASHIATYFGGPDLLTDLQHNYDTFGGPLVALLMIAAYYIVDVALVARAAAWDQGRPFWQLARARSGLKGVTDVGLGLLGAAFGVFFVSAPLWTPALLFPVVPVFLGKKTLDSAERRSTRRALTSRVGRAVAGTLDPVQAFSAITDSGVLDALKLDGLAFMPLCEPPIFHERVGGPADYHSLRTAVARRAGETGQGVAVSPETKASQDAATWLSSAGRA